MSRRKRSGGEAKPEKRDQAMRLAVAATTLGMTMGIVPASVLGAEEAQSASKASPQVQDSAGAEKPSSRKVKLDPVEFNIDDKDAAAKASAPGAGNFKHEKVELPPAAMHKGEKPGAVMHKGEQPEAATQKSGQASGPGGPTYDLATSKKP